MPEREEAKRRLIEALAELIAGETDVIDNDRESAALYVEKLLLSEHRADLLIAAEGVDRAEAEAVRLECVERGRTNERLWERAEAAEVALRELEVNRDEAVRLLAAAIRDGWRSFAAADFLARAAQTGGE